MNCYYNIDQLKDKPGAYDHGANRGLVVTYWDNKCQLGIITSVRVYCKKGKRQEEGKKAKKLSL